MYLLGFAIGKSQRALALTFRYMLTLLNTGPMLLAPLSEYYGRNPVYIGSWFILVMFQIPLALAHNMPTVIVCRLIQGFGGSAPLTNTGGSISDVWERNESGNAMMVYGLSSTFSPPMALVITGYLVLNEGWRNLFWALMGITGGILIIMTLLLPETRHSTILEEKAKAVRKTLVKEGASHEATDRISDAHSMGSKRSMHTLFAVNLTRPFKFLFTEEITMAAAAYNGFIYGVVYLFNESFPLVFGSQEGHEFNVGQTGLTFLGIAVGALVAASFYPLQERYYLRRVAENGGKGVPEARMSQARFGALLLPISLFWFAWTSYRSIHWIVPIIGSSLFGAGIYIVILGVLNYVVDSYQTYSASALAGVILVRNVVGCIFPLFAVSPSPVPECSVTVLHLPDKWLIICTAPDVREAGLPMGRYAAGFPQSALRADSDLVVLQGQGFEDEVAICKVREFGIMFYDAETELTWRYLANISTKTRMRHTRCRVNY
jgi:multidrug resistance protein